jgi:uroporphyrinogen-III synthase
MAANRLKGKRIVLTKCVREKDEIKSALTEAGAEVLHLPLIEVKALGDPARSLEVFKGIAIYDWIIFSSVNGAHYFFETFFKAFKDIRCIGPARIACVGKQTAAEVASFHLEVDLIPQEANAVALAEALIETGSLPNVYVLWVSGDKVNDPAVRLLEGKGEAIVDVFTVYQSKLRSLKTDAVAVDFRKKGADAIFFASPSAVESFVEQVDQLKTAKGATAPKTVSIGSTTSDAMRKLKIPIDRECKSPDAADVIAAFEELLS